MPCSQEEPEDYNNVRGEAKLVASSLLTLDKNKVYVLTNSDTLRCKRVIDHDEYHESREFLKVGTPHLCSAIKQLTEEQLNIFVYDGRNPQARQLATWWEKHQQQDRRREKLEAERAKEKILAQRILDETPMTQRDIQLFKSWLPANIRKSI